MNILALETSCDDTAAAIVEDGRKVLSNIIHSQNELHAQYGGVIPEMAARRHIEVINTCIDEALQQAGDMTLEDIDCFAATLGPGLAGSLLIGANTAKMLSVMTGKPFHGVHHLYAHVCSNYLNSELSPPFLCLLISGGHTQLLAVNQDHQMNILGESLDDAVGEAYDKIARLMDLGFPGGPALDKLSTDGDPRRFPLPSATTKAPFDFSFSGLKTAALRTYEQATQGLDPEKDVETLLTIKRDMAASFQFTVVETLFKKTLACAKMHHLNTIAIAGGVSANRGVRKRFMDFAAQQPDYRIYIPNLGFCTDNAAMVASSAYYNPITDDLGREVFSRDGGEVTTVRIINRQSF